MRMTRDIQCRPISNDTVQVSLVDCFGSHKAMFMNISAEEFNAGLKAWDGHWLIQEALPGLTMGEREFLMTGTTPEEWDELFGDIASSYRQEFSDRLVELDDKHRGTNNE